jgi:hypothetical protein
MSRPLWRENYKSDWCVACTGDKNTSGVWAHWERKDGLTLCGEWHKPADYPMSVSVEDVKAAWAKREQEEESAARAKKNSPIRWPEAMEPSIVVTIQVEGYPRRSP